MNKKRVLICGISMPCAGTEKALLSFLNTVDRAAYEITLLLAKPEGALMTELPPDIRVLGPMQFGEMFTLSAANAPRVLGTLLLHHPSAIGTVLASTLRLALRPDARAHIATRMWVKLMKRYCPSFASEFEESEPFDLVLSFWGDRTMFYACDKVSAARHLTWLHFDYHHPPREDALYHAYFARCDRVISVTEDCTRLLRTRFPSLAARMITFENRISPARIRALATDPCPLPAADSETTTILTVARICEQKGTDRIPEVLGMLTERGIKVRWLLLGDGSKEERQALLDRATERGVADRLILLGTDPNPYPYLAVCDIFALPSRFEGKPITVEEAKILGCPIVVCDYLAARKQLENGKLGILVPQDRGEGMAGALEALIRSPALRESYRKACLDAVSDMPGQGYSETDRLLSGQV